MRIDKVIECETITFKTDDGGVYLAVAANSMEGKVMFLKQLTKDGFSGFRDITDDEFVEVQQALIEYGERV